MEAGRRRLELNFQKDEAGEADEQRLEQFTL
jgi:hypothetical protein